MSQEDLKAAQQKFMNAYQEVIRRSATDSDFRSQVLANPKKVLEDLSGLSLPESLKVNVAEQTQEEVTLLLPPLANESSQLSDADLEEVSGGTIITAATVAVTFTLAAKCF